MNISYKERQKRWEVLNRDIDRQVQAYSDGYLQALKDYGILLIDIKDIDLEVQYRIELLEKALKRRVDLVK